MAELKTRRTSASVMNFLDSVGSARRADACRVVNEMMARISGEDGAMWGDSIVGFGGYRYTDSRGDSHEWFISGFSPRKQALTLYIMPGYGMFDDVMARLGKHKTGKACLYIKSLDDIDLTVLEELITKSVDYMVEKYPG